MSWTKRQFIEQAFEEIGYAPYTYDIESEQLNAGLRRLDAMMATWNSQGIRIGYPLPNSPSDSDLDDLTAVPDMANEAIYLNLSIRLAPSVGKAVSVETKVSAREAYLSLLTQNAIPGEMQYDRMIAGAGNKTWQWKDDPFLNSPTDSLEAGNDSDIEFE